MVTFTGGERGMRYLEIPLKAKRSSKEFDNWSKQRGNGRPARSLDNKKLCKSRLKKHGGPPWTVYLGRLVYCTSRCLDLSKDTRDKTPFREAGSTDRAKMSISLFLPALRYRFERWTLPPLELHFPSPRRAISQWGIRQVKTLSNLTCSVVVVHLIF